MNLTALGITPKTPLGARVTLGRQPPDNLGNGYPIAKDRFWIMSVKADAATVQGNGRDRTQRYLTPAAGFEAYNADPFLVAEQWEQKAPDRFNALIERSPELQAAITKHGSFRAAMEAHRRPRRTLHGVIVHRRPIADVRRGDGFAWFRRAANEGKAGGLTLIPNPHRAPSCISEDGITARRWSKLEPNDPRYVREKHEFDYVDTPCLGAKCPFFADGTGPGGRGQACQKHVTIEFQLRWPNATEGRAMPAVLAELDTSGTYNHAADAISGLLADVARQWSALGLPGEPDYYGLPFLLRLVHVTKPGANGQPGRAFWTVEAVTDLPSGMTIQEWAIGRARMLADNRPLFDLVPAHGARAGYLEARDLPDHASIPAVEW